MYVLNKRSWYLTFGGIVIKFAYPALNKDRKAILKLRKIYDIINWKIIIQSIIVHIQWIAIHQLGGVAAAKGKKVKILVTANLNLTEKYF